MKKTTFSLSLFLTFLLSFYGNIMAQTAISIEFYPPLINSGAPVTNGTNSLTNGVGYGSFAFVPLNATDDILFTVSSSGLSNSASINTSHWNSAIISDGFDVGGIGFNTGNITLSSPASSSTSTSGNLYYLISNSQYDLVKYDVSTSSVVQTRPNILGAGIPSSMVFNSSDNSLHWQNNNFGAEHIYSITNAFTGSTNITQESATQPILSNPRYIAYDATNDQIFVTETNFVTQVTFIRSYDPDGTNPSSVLQSFSSTFIAFTGIALDVPNGEMYWSSPFLNYYRTNCV